MVCSDDCLSNCNQDVIPQLMAYTNYINEEARIGATLPTGSSFSPGQGTPGAGDISSMPRPMVQSLPTSILIHLTLILLMRRIQPLPCVIVPDTCMPKYRPPLLPLPRLVFPALLTPPLRPLLPFLNTLLPPPLARAAPAIIHDSMCPLAAHISSIPPPYECPSVAFKIPFPIFVPGKLSEEVT